METSYLQCLTYALIQVKRLGAADTFSVDTQVRAFILKCMYCTADYSTGMTKECHRYQCIIFKQPKIALTVKDQSTQERGNRLCENGDMMVWNLEGRQMEGGAQTETLISF